MAKQPSIRKILGELYQHEVEYWGDKEICLPVAIDRIKEALGDKGSEIIAMAQLDFIGSGFRNHLAEVRRKTGGDRFNIFRDKQWWNLKLDHMKQEEKDALAARYRRMQSCTGRLADIVETSG